jgi:hypothetical protein
MRKVAFAGQAAHADDPARVLTGLNGSLCGKFEERFVTAAYLFVDLERSRLRYSAAGHPPLLLASRAGEVREIEENGLMLGMFPEAAYSTVEVGLSLGDRCLLYQRHCRRWKLRSKHAARPDFQGRGPGDPQAISDCLDSARAWDSSCEQTPTMYSTS